MLEDLGKGTPLKLERRMAETNWFMKINLEIEIQGEVLQVRDRRSKRMAWSRIYPDQIFSAQGVPFTYNELRGMGNGKTQVNDKQPVKSVTGALLPDGSL